MSTTNQKPNESLDAPNMWLRLWAVTVVVEHGIADCLRFGVLVVVSLLIVTPPPPSLAGCC